MQSSDILSLAALAAAGVGLAIGLRDLFRMPATLTVTHRGTGQTVVLNTRAGREEGRKLQELLPAGRAAGGEEGALST